MTYHLLLVLCVLGDEQSNTLTDTTLLEELFELFLYGYIQRVELEMQKKKGYEIEDEDAKESS